mmetsp:Transcript_30214/g.42815  ORF Transcript_30214/g.42815 Transcript_30214/m.42815 type:complete len:192 (+) Transcript_30214:51-626(+)
MGYNKITFTLLWAFFFVLLLGSILGLLLFLKKLTKEWAHPDTFNLSKHWYRFIVPTVVAVILATGGGAGDSVIFHWVYFLVVGIIIPFVIAFFLLRDSLEKKNERILATVALLFILNASTFTARWYWHYRQAHVGNEGDNPHKQERNTFMIPLWIITILVTIGAGFVWKKANRKENDSLLPTTEDFTNPTA